MSLEEIPVEVVYDSEEIRDHPKGEIADYSDTESDSPCTDIFVKFVYHHI